MAVLNLKDSEIHAMAREISSRPVLDPRTPDATARRRRISAVNWLETQMVVESRYGRSFIGRREDQRE